MIQDIFFERQWAESVRLYSGLLEGKERESFILKISKKNILLAAECKSILAKEELFLENQLTETAIIRAKSFKKTATSAKGFLALSELERFDEISNILSSIKTFSGSHTEVISNFISNGTEYQVATLLKIVSEIDRKLFIQALDKCIDLEINFSNRSVQLLKDLAIDQFNQREFLTCGKIICAIKIKLKNIEIVEIFLALLKNQNVKNAGFLSQLYDYKPKEPQNLTNFVELYVTQKAPEKKINNLIELIQVNGYEMNQAEIAIAFSQHLNPKIKNKYFTDISSFDQATLKKIIDKQLEIGSKSSVELALILIRQANLFRIYPIGQVITVLTKRLTASRLELSLELIQEFNLNHIFSIDFIYTLLLNSDIIQSNHLIIEHIEHNVNANQKIEEYFKIISILNEKEKTKKLIRKILFERINSIIIPQDFRVNNEYYGVVLNLYKNHYTIVVANNVNQISIPKAQNFLKIGSILKFKLISFNEARKAEIKVLRKNVNLYYRNKYIFGEVHIGQIVVGQITEIEDRRLLISLKETKTGKRILGQIHISEIGHKFYKNLNAEFKLGEKIKAVIIDQDRKTKTLILSRKLITPKTSVQNNSLSSLSQEEFRDKLKRLEYKLNS